MFKAEEMLLKIILGGVHIIFTNGAQYKCWYLIGNAC